MKVLCVRSNLGIVRGGKRFKTILVEGNVYKVTDVEVYHGEEYLEIDNDTSCAFSWEHFIPLSNICEKKILKERVLNAINTFKL